MSRAIWALLAGAAIGLTALPAIIAVPPVLLWNASASVPIGLYAVHRPGALHLGDIVVIRPPEPLARDLDARRSLPMGVPLIKPVAALAGQTICRRGNAVTIGGTVLAQARDRDGRGRSLPTWQGCRRLGPDDVFLLNPAQPDSFDGRYFGALPARTVIGRATPLWLPKEP